jgi:hypothetical protein
VVREFVANLPEALQADVARGREFLRNALVRIQVEDGEDRSTLCPAWGVKSRARSTRST